MPVFTSLGSLTSKGFGSRGVSEGPGPITPIDSSFVHIETLTVSGSSVSTLDFTSIPSTYKHLQVRTMLRSTRNDLTDYLGIRFNDSSTTYTYMPSFSRGHTATAQYYYSTATYGYVVDGATAATATANTFGVAIIDIHEYRNTTVRRSFLATSGTELGSSAGLIAQSAIHWPSATAVTKVTLLCNAQFVAGSTASLYGIKDS